MESSSSQTSGGDDSQTDIEMAKRIFLIMLKTGGARKVRIKPDYKELIKAITERDKNEKLKDKPKVLNLKIDDNSVAEIVFTQSDWDKITERIKEGEIINVEYDYYDNYRITYEQGLEFEKINKRFKSDLEISNVHGEIKPFEFY
jgi:hypothetical protein